MFSMNVYFISIFFLFFYIKTSFEDNRALQSTQDNCSFGKIYDAETNTCFNCKNNSFYDRGECVDSCKQSDKIIEYLNVCYKCNDPKHLFYRGDCVTTCPEFTIADFTDLLCTECLWNSTYFYGGLCVDKCPSSTVLNTKNHTCINCKDEGKYYFNNSCVNECPFGTTLYDAEYNLCLECKFQGKFTRLNGICGDTCDSDEEAADDKTLECYKCSDSGRIMKNGRCVDSCIDGILNEHKTVCRTCIMNFGVMYYDQSSSSCVRNCGINSCDYKNNVCVTDLQKLYSNNNKYCINGVPEFINTNDNFICRCNYHKGNDKYNFYGMYCDINSDTYNEIYTSRTQRLFDFMDSISKSSNLNIKNDPYFSTLFIQDLLKIVMYTPQLAFEFSDKPKITTIQSFIQTYYSSNEIYDLSEMDLLYFFYLNESLFSLQYYLLWFKYNNYFEATRVAIEVPDLVNNLLFNYISFIQRLNLFAYIFSKSIVKDLDTSKEYFTGNYNKYYSPLNTIRINSFLSNRYNYNLYKKTAIINYESFFTIYPECKLNNNFFFVLSNWFPDLSFFEDETLMKSNFYYLSLFERNGTIQDTTIDCQTQLYFPMKDTKLFNFSNYLEQYRNLSDIGINSFDENDPYYNDLCYRFPENNTFYVISRLDRIKNYFPNMTVSCNSVDLATNVNDPFNCKFVGFKRFNDLIGENIYATCNCTSISSTSYYFVQFKRYSLMDYIPNPIPQLWRCFDYGLDLTTALVNPGFIFVAVIITFEITTIILHFIFLEILFYNKFKYIRLHDMDFINYLAGSDKKQIQNIMDIEDDCSPKRSPNTKRKSILMIKKEDKDEQNKKRTVEYFQSNSGHSDYCHYKMSKCKLMDKRNFWKYFRDYIYDYHLISITFIKFSFFIPGELRKFHFFLYLICHIFYNTVYLSPEEENVDIFGFSINKTSTIAIYCVFTPILSTLTCRFISLLLRLPDNMRIYLNKVLFQSYMAIREFHSKVSKNYNILLLIYLVCNFSMQIMFSFLILNQNAVYITTRVQIFTFTFCTIIFDFLVISNIIPLLALLLRVMIYKYNLKNWYWLYRLFENLKNSKKYYF